MNRAQAIQRENAAMDELARLNAEREAIELLIWNFRRSPKLIVRLIRTKKRLAEAIEQVKAERADVARHI